MKNLIKAIPVLRTVASRLHARFGASHSYFRNSEEYWKKRYEAGGCSGDGSYGILADFKASVLNRFIEDNKIVNVVEFGCGDGNQLSLANYPSYTGYDISRSAVEQCKKRFTGDTSKTFREVSQYNGEKSELALSLDVIFHLVEDEVFHGYMNRLFNASSRYVIVYSSNIEQPDCTGAMAAQAAPHVRHRKFACWIEQNMKNWALKAVVKNPYEYSGDDKVSSFADFYIFELAKTP